MVLDIIQDIILGDIEGGVLGKQRQEQEISS